MICSIGARGRAACRQNFALYHRRYPTVQRKEPCSVDRISCYALNAFQTRSFSQRQISQIEVPKGREHNRRSDSSLHQKQIHAYSKKEKTMWIQEHDKKINNSNFQIESKKNIQSEHSELITEKINGKEFRKMFGDFAEIHGFKRAYNAWFKESSECIIVLTLQKSYYGNNYNFTIKIFIKNIYNCKYSINQDLTQQRGNIFSGEPKNYTKFFDLEESLDQKERKQGLESLFTEYIAPLTELALSLAGIKQLHQEKRVILFPAVQAELERLSNHPSKKNH